MAKHTGRDILLKMGDGQTSETFTTVAGLRARDLTINEELVDITNADSADNWRELLEEGGTRMMSVSGTGLVSGSDSEKKLRELFDDGVIRNFEIVIPDVGTYEGGFKITSLGFSGEYNQEATFSISLESANKPTFTAS